MTSPPLTKSQRYVLALPDQPAIDVSGTFGEFCARIEALYPVWSEARKQRKRADRNARHAAKRGRDSGEAAAHVAKASRPVPKETGKYDAVRRKGDVDKTVSRRVRRYSDSDGFDAGDTGAA